MKIKIESDTVKVFAKGVELLKIKADVSARIGVSNVHGIKGEGFEFHLSRLPAVADLFPDADSDKRLLNFKNELAEHLSVREKIIKDLEENQIRSLGDFWDRTLDPHQAIAVNAMTEEGLKGLCLFDEQGSGKTVMAIAAFDILKKSGGIDKAVILCPKSMIEEWKADFRKFTGTSYEVRAYTDDKDPVYPKGLEEFDVYIANYDSLEKIGSRLSSVAETKKFLLIADESFYLKNPEATRSDLALQLRHSCVKGFVLCGTPAPNSYLDVVNQFNIADGGVTFAGFKPVGKEKQDKDKLEELLDNRGIFIRRLKKDIYPELAEKEFNVVNVSLNKRQQFLYEEAKKSLYLYLSSLDNEKFKKDLTTYFQKRNILLKICSIPKSVDPQFDQISSKVEYLDGLLERLIEKEGRKVVLWSFYLESIAELFKRYSKYSPVVITGSTDSRDRREAVRAFQEDEKPRLFIGNPGAAGAGITLTAASSAVYFSISNQAAHYLQSIDRIHRRGQLAKEVKIYLLVCVGTIEERELAILTRKENAQHDLMGDYEGSKYTLQKAISEIAPG